MNHAFLIQAHNYPELLADIVNLMSAPNHYFFIHIDKKATIYMHSSQAIKQLKLAENGAYPPTLNGLIHPVLPLNWP